MKTISVLLGVFVCGLLVQSALGQNRAKPMTNSDVVSMVKAGLPENIILTAMRSQETNFDNSAAALVDLKNQGVSTNIIGAMLVIAKGQPSTAGQAPATPAGDAAAVPPAPPSPPAAGAQQLQSQPPAIPQSGTQTQGNTNTKTDNSKGGGRGFLDKLKGAQNQVNSAVQQGNAKVQSSVQQGQSAVQQGQTTVKQAEGTANQVQSSVTGQTSTSTTPNAPAPAAQPNATPTATAPGASSIADRTQQAQQRQQQLIAERQKMQADMAACKEQAARIDPQLRTPDAQKAYSSCVQSVAQAAAQARKQAIAK
jgi:hypothetical protein